MHRSFLIKCNSDARISELREEMKQCFMLFEDSIKHNVDVVSVSSGFTGTGRCR